MSLCTKEIFRFLNTVRSSGFFSILVFYLQTEDQYIFIHDAVLEHVICGVTEVPARNLHAHIQNLMQIPDGETVTGLALEFKVNFLYIRFEFRIKLIETKLMNIALENIMNKLS